MPRGKRNTPFQPGHALNYGLRPVSRDPDTNLIMTVACRFCEKFGREQKVGAKRRATQHIKHFKHPFRTENYHQHHLGQHPTKWSEYQTLTDDRKNAFLSMEQTSHPTSEAPLPNPANAQAAQSPNQIIVLQPSTQIPFARMSRRAEPVSTPLKFLVDKQIVDVIVTDIMYDVPTGQQALPKDQLLHPFATLHQSKSDYAFNIPDPKVFLLVRTHVSLGASPKLAATLLSETTKHSLNPQASAVDESTEQHVSALVRCVFAFNYQAIADLLRVSWTFSISFVRHRLKSSSFLDVRLRLCPPGRPIASYHLIALPLPDRYNWESSFSAVIRILDTLHPGKWRKQLLGIVSDGLEHSDGGTYILIERFRGEVTSSVYRTWSAANLLDSAIKRVHMSVLDDLFFDRLLHLIAYVRRQPSLLTHLSGQCPKLVSTHWLNIERCLRWFKSNRVIILQHLQEKKPSCAPSVSWWVLAMAVLDITQAAARTYRTLSAMFSSPSANIELLSQLIQTYSRLSGCKGPVSEDEIAVLHDWDFLEENKYVVLKSSIRGFLSGLGSFVDTSLNELVQQSMDEVIEKVGVMFRTSVIQITAIITSREASNMGSARLPPVLPHELARFSRATFNSDLRLHADRLGCVMDGAEIELIEDEFGQFLEAYHNESNLRLFPSSENSQMCFESGWVNLKKRFSRLYTFFSGLATVFPDVCDEYKDTQSFPLENGLFETGKDFIVEGCLHCRQYTGLFDALELI